MVRINLDSEQSEYAENPDSWFIFLLNRLNWQFELEKFSTNGYN